MLCRAAIPSHVVSESGEPALTSAYAAQVPSVTSIIAEKFNMHRLSKSFAPVSSEFRNAYEPIRNDIGSMRRLRVTRGICLPSDYPIHLVAGSKDVIHSWAIPGLGIKIDCIPGYNCHRRVLFR